MVHSGEDLFGGEMWGKSLERVARIWNQGKRESPGVQR